MEKKQKGKALKKLIKKNSTNFKIMRESIQLKLKN